jgi:hypothetical protein
MGSQKVGQGVLVILSEAKNLVFSTGGKMIRGIYPAPETEILRFAQNDRRRVQDDSLGLFASLSLLGF